MNKIKSYIEDVVKEMRKVSWPPRRELINNTVVTLAASLAVSLFIFGADWIISRALEILFR